MSEKKTEPIQKGWSCFSISELLAPLDDGRTLHQGWSPRCEKGPSVSEADWGVLKTTSIQPAAFFPEHNKRLPDHLEPRPQIEVKPGDILITCAGPRNRCGIACLVRTTRRRLMMSGKMYRFRPDPARVDPRYLEAYLQSADAQSAIDEMKTGGNESGLNLTHDRFRKLLVPVAPLDQQKRIVAEIEKQFSRLEEAIANLKRVKANLKRYKAAVLKAAVEGRLVETEAELARREGRSYETGTQFLQRILETRRSQWKGKGKYKEPAAPDTTDLSELPEGWVWATMPQLGELNRGKSKHRPRDEASLYGGPYPFIQTGDVRKSEGNITEYSQTYSELGLQQSRLWPAGTLCITIAANIAETGILRFSACFPDSIVGFFADEAVSTTQYVEYFIRTAREKLEQFAPATAQKNINLEVLEAVAVPLPPLAEQCRVVAEVDRRLSLVSKIEVQIDVNLRRAERLRQSVLAKSFSGA